MLRGTEHGSSSVQCSEHFVSCKGEHGNELKYIDRNESKRLSTHIEMDPLISPFVMLQGH